MVALRDRLANSQLAHAGGGAIMPILDTDGLAVLQTEALAVHAHAVATLVEEGDGEEDRGGSPERALESAVGGPALQSLYHAPGVLDALGALTDVDGRRLAAREPTRTTAGPDTTSDCTATSRSATSRSSSACSTTVPSRRVTGDRSVSTRAGRTSRCPRSVRLRSTGRFRRARVRGRLSCSWAASCRIACCRWGNGTSASSRRSATAPPADGSPRGGQPSACVTRSSENESTTLTGPCRQDSCDRGTVTYSPASVVAVTLSRR